MTYSIDSGWVVQAVDTCTCGMGRGSVYGHEAFCGLEQECRVEEFDAWVKHMWGKAREEQKSEWQQVLSDVCSRERKETLLKVRAQVAERGVYTYADVLVLLDTMLTELAGVQTLTQESQSVASDDLKVQRGCIWSVTTDDGVVRPCKVQGEHVRHEFDNVFTPLTRSFTMSDERREALEQGKNA